MADSPRPAEIVSALTAYYEALYYGDPRKLDDAFTSDALLVGDVNDVAVRLTVDQYRQLLATRPSPQSKGEPYAFAIRDVRQCGKAALAELTTPLNGIVFTDYASLVQRDGRWRIAFKLFSHNREEASDRAHKSQ
jgi:hypothetical protein